MPPRPLSGFLRRGFLAVALVAIMASVSQAAPITWGTPTGIAGDSDVSTAGTFAGAFNINGLLTTINGVTFQPLAAGSVTNTGSVVAPFSALSAAYQSLLRTAVTGSPVLVTISGLTVGQRYEIQIWVNDSLDSLRFGFNSGVDGAVELDPNTTNVEGGLGQFVIGAFTADSTQQSFTVDNSEIGGLMNGFQIRQVDAAAVVPEPLSALAWFAACGGLLLTRRRGPRPVA